jgi:carboxylate-amine ligase
VYIGFEASARHTIGVEWELALVNRESLALTSVADQVFDLIDHTPHRVARELLLNTVELVTGICDNVGQAMADLHESMTLVRSATDQIGVDLFSAGMHPFSSWADQQVTRRQRYSTLIDRTQWWGRQMLIYGIHVHVGMPERDRVLPVLNSLLRYFPHLQALSASSPYYEGHDTRYASNRTLLFQQLPTAGLPFQFDTWAQYESYAHDLLTTGVIDVLNEIRWDIRPSPTLGTIEVRVCDAMATFAEVAAMAAFVHCLIVDLDERLAAGETLPTLPPWHVQENKWRSARYGMESIIILDAANREALVTDEVLHLLESLDPVAQRLGCASELAGLAGIVSRGAGYERQRAVTAAAGGDLRALVAANVAELDRSFREWGLGPQ